MDPLMIALRIVHILAGMFWVGAGLFELYVVGTRAVAWPAERQLVLFGMIASKRENGAYGTAAVLTIGSGVAIGLRLKWGALDTWFSAGWGFAILIAFLATLAYLVSSSVTLPKQLERAMALARAADGRSPTPDEATEIQGLLRTAMRSARWQVLLLVVAVGAMASARFL